MVFLNDHKNHKFSLKKNQRLVCNNLFKETFSQGKKIVGKYMVLWIREAPDASLRLGLISSKKMHLRANKRNKARRILREAYRKIRPYLRNNYDVLIISRKSILIAKWKDIFTELLELLLKANLMTKKDYDEIISSERL